ncbi:6-carboxytetrahydropterin synthase QueD [Mucilaginibacter sp. SMC90]|nr:6-carboxytetrahydropterin synthase QueD [Mucilaginibacter sp. SMC90]
MIKVTIASDADHMLINKFGLTLQPYYLSNLFMIIYQHFTFDAAHFLPHVPDGHKCRNLHGHTYHLTLYIGGEILEREGWILDFSDLKAVAAPVIGTLDHTLLNNIEGLENPTAELLAAWIWQKIKPLLPGLQKIELKETPASGVIYEAE